MKVNLTVDAIAGHFADWMLSTKTTPEQTELKLITKFNVITKVGQLSSVMIAIAGIAALFLAFSAACTFALVGIFLRHISYAEMDKYALLDQHDPTAFARMSTGVMEEREKVENILLNVGAAPSTTWERVEANLFGFVFWTNPIPVQPEPAVRTSIPTDDDEKESHDSTPAHAGTATPASFQNALLAMVNPTHQ
ncbi:MAG: hypothetical protein WCF19_04530 [Chlamydiales bacterium]